MKDRPRILAVLPWYYADLHYGIASYAKEHNWNLYKGTLRPFNTFKDWTGDGIISQFLISQPDMKAFVDSKDIPKVYLGETLDVDATTIYR